MVCNTLFILINTLSCQNDSRKDATLREVLTSLRNIAPLTAEYRHPLARYSFRAIYADSAARGRFASKDLGIIYSRDILGEPGSLDKPAPRLLLDVEGEQRVPTEREKGERTLDELRFVPGDYLSVAVLLPKNVTTGTDKELVIKGSAGVAGPNGWKKGGDGGWGGSIAPTTGAPTGRGGGHWRGSLDTPLRGGGRGRGGRGSNLADRNRDFGDRRIPPPRRERDRDSPPHRGGRGGRGARSISKSRSRSRSPPPRRRR